MIRSSPLIGLDIILDHELSKNTLYLMHQNNFSLHIGKNGSSFSDASSHRNSWRSMAVWRKIMCYESIRENLWRTRRGNVYKHKLESVLYETFGWVGNQHCNNLIASLHCIMTGSKHILVFHSCSHINFANFYRLRTYYSVTRCAHFGVQHSMSPSWHTPGIVGIRLFRGLWGMNKMARPTFLPVSK